MQTRCRAQSPFHAEFRSAAMVVYIYNEAVTHNNVVVAREKNKKKTTAK